MLWWRLLKCTDLKASSMGKLNTKNSFSNLSSMTAHLYKDLNVSLNCFMLFPLHRQSLASKLPIP